MERDSISLLAPGGVQPESRGLEARSAVDLDLHTTIAALCEHADQQQPVRQILEALCRDADTIRYRFLRDGELPRIDPTAPRVVLLGDQAWSVRPVR